MYSFLPSFIQCIGYWPSHCWSNCPITRFWCSPIGVCHGEHHPNHQPPILIWLMGIFPPTLSDSLWHPLQLVVATQCSQGGWYCLLNTIHDQGWTCGHQHAEQGGVTNGRCYIHLCCQLASLLAVSPQGYRQDLCCILKAGLPSQKAPTPKSSGGHLVGTMIFVTCWHYIVSRHGLLPFCDKLPQFCTIFSQLQPMELLFAWDLPEIHLCTLPTDVLKRS